MRWNSAGRMGLGWLFTLPAAAIVGAVSGRVADSGNVGVAIIAVLAVAAVGFIYLVSRRSPVTAHNVNETSEPTPVLAAA